MRSLRRTYVARSFLYGRVIGAHLRVVDVQSYLFILIPAGSGITDVDVHALQMHGGRSALLQYHLVLANRVVALARPREKARRRLLNFFLTLACATRRYGISVPECVSNFASFFRTRNADYKMHIEKRTYPEPTPSRHDGYISVLELEIARWQRDEVNIRRFSERLFHLEIRNFPLSTFRSVNRGSCRGRRKMK